MYGFASSLSPFIYVPFALLSQHPPALWLGCLEKIAVLSAVDRSQPKVLMVYRVAVELTMPSQCFYCCVSIPLPFHTSHCPWLTGFYFSCPPLFTFLSSDSTEYSTEQSQHWFVYFLPQSWYSMGNLTCRLGEISSIYQKSMSKHWKDLLQLSTSLLCANLCHIDYVSWWNFNSC